METKHPRQPSDEDVRPIEITGDEFRAHPQVPLTLLGAIVAAGIGANLGMLLAWWIH